jgi:hypothetical protein
MPQNRGGKAAVKRRLGRIDGVGFRGHWQRKSATSSAQSVQKSLFAAVRQIDLDKATPRRITAVLHCASFQLVENIVPADDLACGGALVHIRPVQCFSGSRGLAFHPFGWDSLPMPSGNGITIGISDGGTIFSVKASFVIPTD